MSESVAEVLPSKTPKRRLPTLSGGIWIASCLLHLGALWGLSNLSMARGIGAGARGHLAIEGRFLGSSQGTADGPGRGNSDGPEAVGQDQVANADSTLRLVSIARANVEPNSDSASDSETETVVESAESTELASEEETLEPPPEHDEAPPVATSRPIRNERPATRSEGAPTNRRDRPRSDRMASASVDRGRPLAGSGKGGRSGGGTGAGGGTTFFDVAGQGDKFVFVIDRSDSMQYKRRLDAARSELLASLDELSPSAFVQVIFYNVDIAGLNSSERLALVRNTPVHQRKMAQFAAGILPDGGTDHLRAIEAAFSLAPDAIFLLTDAEEPRLDAADLDRLQRANRRRVPIHTIELGIGPRLEADNFLMRLARQSRGTYAYRNIDDVTATDAEVGSESTENP